MLDHTVKRNIHSRAQCRAQYENGGRKVVENGEKNSEKVSKSI